MGNTNNISGTLYVIVSLIIIITLMTLLLIKYNKESLCICSGMNRQRVVPQRYGAQVLSEYDGVGASPGWHSATAVEEHAY